MKYIRSFFPVFSKPKYLNRLIRLSLMALLMSLAYGQTIDYLDGIQYLVHSASVGILTLLIFLLPSIEPEQDVISLSGFAE